MSTLAKVVAWLRLREHWQGPSGIPNRVFQHVEISFVALGAAVVLAVPLAVWLGHRRRFGLLAVNVSNVGRAVPSFAILVIGSQVAGLQDVAVIGSWFVFAALVVLAVPPMVTNAYVGMAEVPDELRDAARGMGLSDWQCLWRVELPVALPLVMAGIRTSAVQVVATATIAAEVGAGGLGRLIVEGLSLGPTANDEVFAGALLVALLALVTEGGFALIQRAVTPRGLRLARTSRREPTADNTAAVAPVRVAVGAA